MRISYREFKLNYEGKPGVSKVKDSYDAETKTIEIIAPVSVKARFLNEEANVLREGEQIKSFPLTFDDEYIYFCDNDREFIEVDGSDTIARHKDVHTIIKRIEALEVLIDEEGNKYQAYEVKDGYGCTDYRMKKID